MQHQPGRFAVFKAGVQQGCAGVIHTVGVGTCAQQGCELILAFARAPMSRLICYAQRD
jgi:hypothetical protein